MNNAARFLAGALALLGAGCATIPDEPPAVSVTGVWRGQWQRGSFSGTAELTLEQMEARVTGDLKWGGCAACTAISGPLQGTVSANRLSYSTTRASGELLVTGDEATGRYGSATVQLHRQR